MQQLKAHRIYRKHRRWMRHIPRRKHLRGGWLHRLLGDKLLAPRLWRFTRRNVAAALALGLFIGFTPTMGAQMALAGIAAYFLRVNLPVALAATLVTNPLTAALVYPVEYQIGVWLAGVPEPYELEGYGGMFHDFVRVAKSLWVGALVLGSLSSTVAYTLVTLLWADPNRRNRTS